MQSLLRAARHGNLTDQHRTARSQGLYRKIPAEITNNYFPMPLRLHTHTCKGKQIENEFLEHSESHSFFVFERRPCLCLRSVIPSLINIPFVSNSGMPLNSFLCAVKETLSMWDLSPQSGRLTLSCITRIYISSTLVDFAKVVSEVVESVYSLANKV